MTGSFMTLRLFGLSLGVLASAAAFSGALAETNKVWALKGFMHPESVYEDTARQVLHVSNLNGAPTTKDGNSFISKVGTDDKTVVIPEMMEDAIAAYKMEE
jgi:hypothetical protein